MVKTNKKNTQKSAAKRTDLDSPTSSRDFYGLCILTLRSRDAKSGRASERGLHFLAVVGEMRKNDDG